MASKLTMIDDEQDARALFLRASLIEALSEDEDGESQLGTPASKALKGVHCIEHQGCALTVAWRRSTM